MTLSAFNKPTHSMHLLKFKKPQLNTRFVMNIKFIKWLRPLVQIHTYTCNNNLILVLVSIFVSVSVYQHYLPKCKGKLTYPYPYPYPYHARPHQQCWSFYRAKIKFLSIYPLALVVLLRQYELTRDKINKIEWNWNKWSCGRQHHAMYHVPFHTSCTAV